ncbi:3-oxoacyl-ACP synthase III family protein [Streptomyces sp. H27-D2]|uniref:3-oxoacyl-ACP synthase III family protein n=1 Tax=Streptomyces sp. H27-D2 TaxID=3046304 RepID=UPI002DBBBD87|nr:ketoacyl-ACP synthase III [Streptomyces sp. H27-D2]MEC4020687.1 ketoacyl-ACP synthase III [Streptomyces sp. H27-D2]
MTRNTADRAIGVLGMGTYLPERIRTNAEVARAAGVSAEWISERTGVHTRHTAAPDEAASDLAAAAVRSAVRAAGIDARSIDVLICATSTPDELGPSTACRIQALVGATHAVALDVSAACSGWLFATKVAHDWLRADETARYAVVVGVEAYSKFLNPADRGTAVLFADGAAAAVLGTVAAPHGFTDFVLGSDGTLADLVLIAAGGSRNPASADTLLDGGHRIRMDGRAVSHFISDVFPQLVHDALDRNGLAVTDIKRLIAHQPNPVVLRQLSRELGLTDDQVTVIGDAVGNIGAASAPFALATAAAEHGLQPGDLALITVFGAGMTWGTVLLQWSGAPSLHTTPDHVPHHLLERLLA